MRQKMKNFTPNKVLSEKNENNFHGRLNFLNETKSDLRISGKLINKLAKDRDFTDQDRLIINRIIESLDSKGTLPYAWTPQEQNYIKKRPEEVWLDYLIYRFKFIIFPMEKIVSNFPIYILIETTSICNLRCVMCFQVDKTFTTKEYMGLMDIDLFRNCIDQAVDGGTQALTLGSRGEPTLHPKISEMLDYMSGKFIELKVITNATKLNEQLSHDILKSKVDILVFSVDAHTKDLYEKIRVRGKFDQVYNNIKRFHEIRDKYYPDSNISTRISAVLVRKEQDIDEFTKFWSKIVDEVSAKNAAYRWDTYSNPVHSDLNTPCNLLWERFYIWWDGTTNPCDPDYKSKLSAGNIVENSIRDIWNGNGYKTLREKHINGGRKDYIPCDRCGLDFS
jgi:organic radical activating enzyme